MKQCETTSNQETGMNAVHSSPTAVGEIFDAPVITTVTSDCLIIRGLPEVKHDELFNSELINIVHRLKHLYKDGDRDGAKAYRAKRKAQQPRENDHYRLCVTYTANFARDERSSYLIIRLMTSNDGNSAYFNEISRGHAKKRKMTTWEITSYAAQFSQDCADEIQAYLDNLSQEVRHTGVQPNYFIPFNK